PRRGDGRAPPGVPGVRAVATARVRGGAPGPPRARRHRAAVEARLAPALSPAPGAGGRDRARLARDLYPDARRPGGHEGTRDTSDPEPRGDPGRHREPRRDLRAVRGAPR